MTTATAPATAGRRAAARTSPVPLLLLGEIALAGVSMAAVLGMRRVFPGTDWLGHLGLQVVLAHALVAVLRRRGTNLLVSTGVTVVVAVVVISWLYAGGTTTLGLPSTTTFEVLSQSVDQSAAAFSDVKAPVPEPFQEGFFILTAIAVWLGAVIGDWAAFRVNASIEAILPAATLFVLGAVFGTDVDRMLLAGVWIAAVLAFVLFRRADRLGTAATWVGERRSTGPRTLVVLGAVLALGAVVAAALIGPHLPGAKSEAVIAPTEVFDSGPGTRVTVSPLVDIRSRLVQQADVEVFTVRSNVRSYWRLTSLDRFDGNLWSSNGSYGEGSGDLDDGVGTESSRLRAEQTFTIEALDQIWLPAAYEPQAVRSETPVRYDEVSGTLIVDTEIPTSDGMAYQVVSAIPEHQPEALASASTEIPDEITETYLGLPDDFPDSIRAKAEEVTAGAPTRYHQALQLQNFFLSEFEYSLEVTPGHGEAAIERFVLEDKRGYCEQFAGSYAAMARSLGIPARVAVGFTTGYASPTDPNLYRVRGQNAHAWPEVYLGEYGWVKFEPTPGRGAPFTQQYTGVPEQQVSENGPPTESQQPATPPADPGPASPTTTGPQQLPQFPDDLAQPVDGATEEEGTNPWPGRLAWASLLLVSAVALYLCVVVAVSFLRRRIRHRAAVDAEAKIALAWDESMRAVRRAGIPVRGAETQQEAATRIGHRLPGVEEPIRTLAITVQDVTYAPVPPDPAVGEEALALAAEIEATTSKTMSGPERFRTRFHPRHLLDR